MSEEKIVCPRCLGNNKREYLVINHKQNCFTCNGDNHITKIHDDLFELGFSEQEDNDVYRLYFEKKLNSLEDIAVLIKSVGENLVIEKIYIKSPYAESLHNQLFNVNNLIDFLKG